MHTTQLSDVVAVKVNAQMTLFVTNPETHIWFRGIALFIVAPILIIKGRQYNDNMLTLIGVGTLLIDGYTFMLSLKSV